jgi:3-oxoacyl-[acyl-carrier protein] reductase
MELNLNGKRALVGGSTQGIGKAVAMELASLGADITLIARNENTLKSVCKELPSAQGQHHHYIIADFTEPELLKAALTDYLEKGNTINILVNNTGGPPGGPVAVAQTNEFEAAFRQHLICNHILATACINGMKQSGYGRIINIISTSVKQPLKGLGVSNTVRAAVANWSKTLATELAPFGITVNNVLPGATKTQRLASLIESKSSKTGKSVADLEKEMMAEIPMGRFAFSEEIASAVSFLASPAASYITGINVPVDGGRTGCL